MDRGQNVPVPGQLPHPEDLIGGDCTGLLVKLMLL